MPTFLLQILLQFASIYSNYQQLVATKNNWLKSLVITNISAKDSKIATPKNFFKMAIIWCTRPESNRYALLGRRILSPVRLPVPPLVHCELARFILTFCLYFVNNFCKILSKYLFIPCNHAFINKN